MGKVENGLPGKYSAKINGCCCITFKRTVHREIIFPERSQVSFHFFRTFVHLNYLCVSLEEI